MCVELVNKDIYILRWVWKFRFCLGRHIKVLVGFGGVRATDRRLKTLVDGGYLARKKYLYSMPYLYTLTHKGRVLLGVNKREDIIRVDRINHDIHVLETVVFYVVKNNVSIDNIVSEKELHIKDGFGARKHHPDFVILLSNKKYAVEIELNPKNKERLEKNIRDNYLNFDKQIWVSDNNKVLELIQKFKNEYSGIEIIHLEEVLNYVRERYS